MTRDIDNNEQSRSAVITRVLEAVGIVAKDLQFHGSDGQTTYFRYQGWRPLPTIAEIAISSLATEEVYEDHVGDDERGRPIIRRLYTYQLITT